MIAQESPNADGLIFEHFPVGALQCVCTIIGDARSGEAIVVDGGAEVERIYARVTALGLRIKHLLYTHAHIDHIGEAPALREKCLAPTAIHPADLPLAQTLRRQAQYLGFGDVAEPIFDESFGDGDTLKLGRFQLEMLHTPGHTPGSTSFAVSSGGAPRLLTGDTLFAGGIGRWDIGGTSMADIVNSIHRKLLIYPDECLVIPGHGPRTTIGIERSDNPYLQ